MKFFILFFLAAAITLSPSCKKNETPAAPDTGTGTRLKKTKTTSSYNSDFFITNYKYDSKNRLITQEDSGVSSIFYKFKFEYDGQDHLIKATETDLDENGDVWRQYVRTFTYDASGKIIRSVETMPLISYGITTNWSFAYDVKGRLIGDTILVENMPDQGLYNKYSYDAQDNLNVMEFYEMDNTLISSNEMKYGTSANNPYQLGQYYFFGTHDARALSKNNLTEEVFIVGTSRQTSNYTYQFSSNGLPTNIRITQDQDPAYQNIELFYE